MLKPHSKLASSLKQLGDIQVSEWDFMGLLNTEIRELEIARSLRELGKIQVMDWDFRSMFPGVKKVANTEVDVIDFFKRTAHCKVMDLDFRSNSSDDEATAPRETLGENFMPPELQAVAVKLKNFLGYAVASLIDEPGEVQIRVAELMPTGLRFQLVLAKKDLAVLIGREGSTASAIRNLLKATAAMHGVQALLQIHSHEDEAAAGAGGGKKRGLREKRADR